MNLSARLSRVEKLVSTNDVAPDVVEGVVEPYDARRDANELRTAIRDLEARGKGDTPACGEHRARLKQAEAIIAQLGWP